MIETDNILSEEAQAARAVQALKMLEEVEFTRVLTEVPDENTLTIESMIKHQPEINVNRLDNTFIAVELTPYYQNIINTAFNTTGNPLVEWNETLQTAQYLGIRVYTEVDGDDTAFNGVDFALFGSNNEMQTPLLNTRVKPSGNGRKGVYVFASEIFIDIGQGLAEVEVGSPEASEYILGDLTSTMEVCPYVDRVQLEEIANSWLKSQNYVVSATDIIAANEREALKQMEVDTAVQLPVDLDFDEL